MERLVISSIWPVQERTNFTHNEAKLLLRKQVLFLINDNLSFLQAYSLGKALFQ
jgi:hypothetical protein